MIDVVLESGERLAFKVDDADARVLYVRSDGRKLTIAEKDGSIASIAGKGMWAVLRERDPHATRRTYKVKEVGVAARLRLSTPSRHGHTGVYVDVQDGKFRIVGGSAIIQEIVGAALASRLEKEED